MADGRHLEKLYYVIFLLRVVRFGWNLADWCRMHVDYAMLSKSKAEVEFPFPIWRKFALPKRK